MSMKEDTGDLQSGFDSSTSFSKPLPFPPVTKSESSSVPLMSKSDMELSESPVAPITDQLASKENLEVLDEAKEIEPGQEVYPTTDSALSPVHTVFQDPIASTSTDITVTEGVDVACVMEFDQYSPAVSSTSASEEASQDLPLVPSYVDLTEEQQKSVSKLAVERIIESYKQMRATGCSQTCMALLARLVAQVVIPYFISIHP